MDSIQVKFTSEMPVELIQHCGNDQSVVWAARVSNKGDTHTESCEDTEKRDRGLIRFLMENRHGSPFEHNSMTFCIRAPLFVWREFHRHRIGFSYNEESGRYKVMEPEFYIPDAKRDMIQIGKAGSYEYLPGTTEQHYLVEEGIKKRCVDAYQAYDDRLDADIAREVARIDLPLNLMSTCYVTCNARSLMNFLSLRVKSKESAFPSYPMHEINQVASKMEIIFQQLFPLTHAAFVFYRRVAP